MDKFIDPNRYDLVLCFTPDVEWVDDGLRWNNEDKIRWKLHAKLKTMYKEKGFATKIRDISGNYNQRLIKATKLIDKLIDGKP